MCFKFVLICTLFMVLGFVLMSVMQSVLFVSYVWVWCVVCCDFCRICDACSWMCSFMGSMCVSSSICCVGVCCAPSCYFECDGICSLLMFVSDASGDHYIMVTTSITIWWKRTRVWVLLWLCVLQVLIPFVSPMLLR